MRYLGGKVRLAKHLYPVMRDDIERLGRYWEPFVGGAGMMAHVAKQASASVGLVGSDTFEPVIELLRAVASGWVPPSSVSEEEYASVKASPGKYPKCLAGFMATACSFSGKPWGGYARQTTAQDYAKCGSNALVKDSRALARVSLIVGDYRDARLVPGAPSVIYCDPPYAETTGYGAEGFDQDAFHVWARGMAELGHAVYISGFACPQGFRVVWQRDRTQHIRKGGVCPTVTELLYVPDLKTT